MTKNYAEQAKQASYQFECKKDGLRQNQDGSAKVTFNIHPDDMPAELWRDPMGQRYMAVLVPLNEDETPKKNEDAERPQPSGIAKSSRSAEACDKAEHHRKWFDMPYAQRAGIMSTDAKFHTFLSLEYPDTWLDLVRKILIEDEAAAQFIRNHCGVKSRSELNTDTKAQSLFDKLNSSFTMWMKYEAESVEETWGKRHEK